jgi:hypothetical protein
MMWKHNFLFRGSEGTPLEQTENDLFHDAEPAMDSAGMNFERYLSVWIQGEATGGAPSAYTNLYVRTATLDVAKGSGFLQPLQGRAHQIKQMLTPDQKSYLRQWLARTSPTAWEGADDQFRDLLN